MLRLSLYANVALLIVCAALYAFWQHADAEMSRLQAKQGKEQVGAVAEANKRARELQRRLDSLPKAEEPTRELVRQNPASCERPVPVARGLSEAVRKANAARALPTHP